MSLGEQPQVSSAAGIFPRPSIFPLRRECWWSGQEVQLPWWQACFPRLQLSFFERKWIVRTRHGFIRNWKNVVCFPDPSWMVHSSTFDQDVAFRPLNVVIWMKYFSLKVSTPWFPEFIVLSLFHIYGLDKLSFVSCLCWDLIRGAPIEYIPFAVSFLPYLYDLKCKPLYNMQTVSASTANDPNFRISSSLLISSSWGHSRQLLRVNNLF